MLLAHLCALIFQGTYNVGKMNDLFGDGIFAVDGGLWRHQRKLASLEFSTKVLRDFSTAVFRKNAARLASKVSEASMAKEAVDLQVCAQPKHFYCNSFSIKALFTVVKTFLLQLLCALIGCSFYYEYVFIFLPLQDLLLKSSLDSIFKVGFGVDLNTLSGSDQFSNRFMKAFDDCNELTYWRYVDQLWKIKRFLNIGREAALKQNIRVIDNFVYEVIRLKREQMINGKSYVSITN